jgi:hypothetical protein
LRDRSRENARCRRDGSGGPFALCPYPITERNEIGSGVAERHNLVEACGKADAWHFE